MSAAPVSALVRSACLHCARGEPRGKRALQAALSAQLQQGIADFLRYTFWSSTPFASGSDLRFFPDIPLSFLPHAHQERAFERLGGSDKRSTLVAIGTGSGKTESFLLPILDHCLRDAAQEGVTEAEP
jgi:ATP-dependent helicase YprA (DUF1998 family)